LQLISDQLSMEIFLDPENLTVLNYELTSDPQFTENAIITRLRGDIHPVQLVTCPFLTSKYHGKEVFNTNSLNTSGVMISINELLLECGYFTFQETGILMQEVNRKISSYLDGRFFLGLNFLSGFNLSIHEMGIAFQLPTLVYFNNSISNTTQNVSNTNVYEPFLTIETNVSLNVLMNATESISAGGIVIVGSLPSMVLQFYLIYLSPSAPKDFSAQINATNFNQLSLDTNEFIQHFLLPMLNQELSKGIVIPLPPLVMAIIDNLKINFLEDLIWVTFDFQTLDFSNCIPVSFRNEKGFKSFRKEILLNMDDQ